MQEGNEWNRGEEKRALTPGLIIREDQLKRRKCLGEERTVEGILSGINAPSNTGRCLQK